MTGRLDSGLAEYILEHHDVSATDAVCMLYTDASRRGGYVGASAENIYNSGGSILTGSRSLEKLSRFTKYYLRRRKLTAKTTPTTVERVRTRGGRLVVRTAVRVWR